MAEAVNLPFIHVPVAPDTKPEAEQRLIEIVEEHDVDLVVKNSSSANRVIIVINPQRLIESIRSFLE